MPWLFAGLGATRWRLGQPATRDARTATDRGEIERTVCVIRDQGRRGKPKNRQTGETVLCLRFTGENLGTSGAHLRPCRDGARGPTRTSGTVPHCPHRL